MSEDRLFHSQQERDDFENFDPASPDPTAGSVLGEAIFEDPRVSAVRRELKEGWAVGNIRAAALLAAYDELSASALSAAREAGREEGRREEREQIAERLMEARWLGDAFAPWAQAAKIALDEANSK